MSVTVIAHFSVADVEKAIAGLQANAALLEEITEDTKGGGIIHQTSWWAEASSSSSTSGKRLNSSKLLRGQRQGREGHGTRWRHRPARRCDIQRI